LKGFQQKYDSSDDNTNSEEIMAELSSDDLIYKKMTLELKK